jgi:hypothetical protein
MEKNIDLPNYDLMHDVTSRLSNNLNGQFEASVIEGLKRKGFEFENKLELKQFVKDHCRCEDNVGFQQRIYYVNDVPFFLHNYKCEMSLNPINEDKKTILSASYGYFAYL